jgi:hypothetical protein
MLRKASRPASEERRPAIGENKPPRDARMADRHLQHDEAAITITEHRRIFAACGVPHRFGHAVGDCGEATPNRVRSAKARQFRHDHAKRFCERREDGIKARAVRQQ